MTKMKRAYTYTGKSVEGYARKFCCEDISLIENYDLAKADNFKGWCVHHRLEFLPCQQRWVSKQELISKGIYYNRPAWELIFMKRGDHVRFHNQDPNRKAKISEAKKGKKQSDEHKKKLGEAHRKPFEIDGIHFERLLDAAKHLGVGQGTIWKWLNGKTKTDHNCRYLCGN